MGQIADDMLDGTCCAICGQYFGEIDEDNRNKAKVLSHGHPVACHDCWEEDCGYERAKYLTL